MKILYLCPKKQYDSKMSRVRFQGMEAIGKITDLVYSGNGWDNYDTEKTEYDNIKQINGEDKPDLVVVYQPLQLKGFKDISIPK